VGGWHDSCSREDFEKSLGIFPAERTKLTTYWEYDMVKTTGGLKEEIGGVK